MLLRRKRMTPGEFTRARLDLSALMPVIDDEAARLTWSEILDLAERFGLTVYDAAYVELSIRKGLPLASRDSALNEAARRCGVNTLL